MLRLRRRHDLRATGSDAGITLVELLVTMTLMSIVSALALSWVIGESRADTTTQNSSVVTGDARAVLDTWPALLRVADAPWHGRTATAASPTATVAAGDPTGRFLAIGPRIITFNANLSNAPAASCGDSCARGDTTQVTLALTSTGALRQTLVTSAGTTASTTLVSHGAATTGCLFTAYDSTGTRLNCGSATPLGAIARVVLAFTVTPDGGGSPQSFTTSVNLTGSFASAPTATPPAGA